MVNNGASKACHACKKMHKKCDETRPFENDADLCRRGKSCLRCSRALRTCPGYEISKDRKFVNYIGAVDFNLLHQRHAGLLHQTPESTHLSTLDWPNIEKDARLAFFDDYCIVSLNQNLSRGYLNGLQTMIDRAGPNSELAQACTIIALVNLGKKLGKHTYIERAETLYSLLLRSFRLKISNEAIFTTLESMITAALLGLYEIVTSTDAYPGAHVAHAWGVSAILVSRFSPFDLMCGGKLFQVASPILLEDPEAKSPEPTPLQYSPTINKKVARRFSVLCTPLLNQSGSTIDLVYAQTEPLIRRAESMLGSETTIDQIRALKLEAEQLKEAYYMWPKTNPPEWTPRPVGTIVSIADEVSPDVGYWPCKVYSYYDLYVASIWNSYRKACLLVLNIIMSCNRRINGISNGLESDTSIQKDAAELAEGIVSSISYLLAADIQAFVENAASGSPPIVPGRPVGGLLSMYTFYVLSTLPMAGAKLKVYLRRCLAWIGTRMSIGQATILSKCTNMDQFSYATEARVIIWTEHESIHRYEGANPFASLLALFQETDRDKLEINEQDAEGITPLHLAAMKSELDVARLLKAGADATILTHTGRSALHLACRARKSNIIALLLHKLGQHLLDLPDSFGRAPLHDTCVSGRPESVYYLLKWGANINLKDNMGCTPLHSCAEFSNEQKIWYVLEHQNIAAGQLGSDRFRPSASTSEANVARHESLLKHPKVPVLTENETARIGGIVKSLVAAGADLDAADTRNLTLLEVALSYGCLDMVKVLWSVMIARNPSYKLDPHYIQLQTLLALNQRVSISAEHPDIVTQELLRMPSHYLSILEDEGIDWILESLSDIPGPDRDSIIDSLICTAAQRGLIEIITSIGSLARVLDHSTIVQERSKKLKHSRRQLPLQAACKRELPNLKTLEVLIDKCGADVNKHEAVDPTIYSMSLGARKGFTALHYLAEARYWCQLDGVRLLVQKGANLNAQNEMGETPLHIASRGNGVGCRNESKGQDFGFWRSDCVRLLVDLGADLNALDKSGETPLQKAASRAPEIMEILLQHGADISGRTSPLFSAIRSGNTQMVQTLLARGANPNAIDVMKSCPTYFPVADEERSALLCACFPSSGHDSSSTTAIVKLLLQHDAIVNMPLHTDETFLHFIFQHAPYSTIAAFLECPSVLDFEARDQQGRTILLAACAWTSRGWMPQNSKGKTCIDGSKSPIRAPVLALLDLGADISARDPQGRHALHCLLSNPNADDATVLAFLAHLLVQPLALLPSPITGIMPLHCALETLHPTACFALMDLGADILARDPRNGATALHFVAARALETYICGLREHILCPEGYLDGCLRLWGIYFERVRDRGESINVRDGKGETPLFSYLRSKTWWGGFKVEEKLRLVGGEKKKVMAGHMECFEEFFGGKAVDFCARNPQSETVLHILAGREEVDLEDSLEGKDKNKGYQRALFSFLMEKGAHPWAKGDCGRSAIDVAATMGKKGILGLFQAKN